MASNQKNNFKLGLFVSISIALFIGAIYLIGDRSQLFSHTFHLSGIFNNIDGLQVGNNVRFSGINVGVVGEIKQVTDSTVSVDMLVNDNTRKFIKKNAKAVIGSDGLMGNKIVSIVPGVQGMAAVANNDVLETIRPINMDDILKKLKTTTDNAASLSDDIVVIMKNIREGRGTVGKLLMDSSFARNIDKTIVNIKQGTSGFKQNMDAASHNFLLRGFLKKKKKKEQEQKQ